MKTPNLIIMASALADWKDGMSRCFDYCYFSFRGVITEIGVAEAAEDAGADGVIDIPAFLRSRGLHERVLSAAQPSSSPTGYKRMDENSIAGYINMNTKISF